jgi:hypothetical protein
MHAPFEPTLLYFERVVVGNHAALARDPQQRERARRL